MLPPDDPHSSAFSDHRQELLVLTALGEPVDDWFDSHQQTCSACQQDVAAYRETVTLARIGEGDGERSVSGPPAAVWAGIAHTLGFDERVADRSVAVPVRPTSAAVPAARWSRRWRVGVAAAAAVIAVSAGIGVGAIMTRNRDTSSAQPQILSQAALVEQPGGPASVSGAAKVHTSTLGLAITVYTAGLPLRHGYYQVWLYDPAAKHMLPVGALNDDGRGTFTIPAGVDLRTYDVVDISAQDYNGEYEHQKSVLQGPLTH